MNAVYSFNGHHSLQKLGVIPLVKVYYHSCDRYSDQRLFKMPSLVF